VNILAVHLLTNPSESREQRSILEVSKLALFGIKYLPVTNPYWRGPFPPAREANDRGFTLKHGHYGCYMAHKSAIEQYLNDSIDALLICECDCVFTLPTAQLVERIERAYRACVEHDLLCFTFGPKHGGNTVTDMGDNMVTTTRLIETHCYMIPIGAKERVLEIWNKPWDAADYIWTVYGWDRGKHRIGIFDDCIVAVQGDGESLIDGRVKNSETHFRWVVGNE
jgi:hypothetical protein